MSATEWWLLAAMVVAGLGVICHLVAARPARRATTGGPVVVVNPAMAALGHALVSAAVGLVAIGLLVALP